MPREVLSNWPRICSSCRPIWVMTVSKLHLRSLTARCGMGLRFVAQALDLLQRGLRLTRGVAGERRADLLGAGFRIAHRVLDHAGIGAHDVVEVLRLGVDRVQQRDDRLMPAFQDRIDLGVGRIERLGGGEDRLALILEALGEPVDLVEQPARHLAQRLGLAGEDRDRFLRLRADLICGLLHDRRIIGQHLIELRRLLAEGLGRGACVLAEHAVGLDRALVEGGVDRLQPLGERDDHGLRPLRHGLVERPVCWLMAVSSALTRWNSELVKVSDRSASVLSSTIAP